MKIPIRFHPVQALIEWHPVVAEPHTVTEEDVDAGIFGDIGETVFLVNDCPDEEGDYLLTVKSQSFCYVAEDHFDADLAMFESFDWDEITAWAEFPEPFKEKQ